MQVAIALVTHGASVAHGDLLHTVSHAFALRLLQSVRRPPTWVGGVACSLCRRGFNPPSRLRHHCRHCGRLVCEPCSRARRRLRKFERPRSNPTFFVATVRVCDQCALALDYEAEEREDEADRNAINAGDLGRLRNGNSSFDSLDSRDIL